MMYPFMTLNDDTEITHSEMKIDGTVKVYIETPNDTGGFHHATCWLPEYKWQDIKGYSNLEIAYFKNYIASVSHIIMELSRTGGFNALYEKASPDLESLKNYQIDNFYLPIDGFLSASILIYYDNRKQSNVFRNNKNIPNCR